jgi:tRNA (guanine-N7-)-methyltransferase
MHTQRRIRSFVLRAGRTTAAQERALEQLWPSCGIDLEEGRLDLTAAFGRSAPRCLEIGFGVGEVIGSLAENNPHIDYLGIEVHRPGVGRLLLRAEAGALKNLRVICDDAVDVLRDHIEDQALDEVLVFFPDPWHKKRHHKRRLIDASFVALVAAKLRAGGTLRIATDWQAYAEQILAVCNGNPELRSLSEDLCFVPRPEFRPATRFERRGHRLGHGTWDFAYTKRAPGDEASPGEASPGEKGAANSFDDELHGERGQDHPG